MTSHLVLVLAIATVLALVALVVITTIDDRRANRIVADMRSSATRLADASSSGTSEDTSAAIARWDEASALADRLVVELALTTASIRIARAFAAS